MAFEDWLAMLSVSTAAGPRQVQPAAFRLSTHAVAAPLLAGLARWGIGFQTIWPSEKATTPNSACEERELRVWVNSCLRSSISPFQLMEQDLSRHQKKASPSYSPPQKLMVSGASSSSSPSPAPPEGRSRGRRAPSGDWAVIQPAVVTTKRNAKMRVRIRMTFLSLDAGKASLGSERVNHSFRRIDCP